MEKIIPLGGLGEIGANMMAFEGKDAGFFIDAGILFPDEDVFSINYLISSFEHLDPKKYRTLFLTHAHEDHIGALIHVLSWNPDLVVYLSPLAKKMATKRLKLEEHLVRLLPWHEHQEINLELSKGSITSIQPLLVDHSIAETYGILIKDIKKSVAIFFCSDFKSQELTLKHSFKKLIDPTLYGTRIAMLDSTNAHSNKVIASEADLIPGLERLMNKKERLFLTFFPSNIDRLNNVIALALKSGRRVLALGRSVLNARETALSTGLATFKESDLMDIDELETSVESMGKNLLFLVSGCQADFYSALRRLTYGEDHRVKLVPGDRMIFSSRIIPGNEHSVVNVYNRLAEQGIHITTASEELIHCSGHASQQDLALILDQEAFNEHVPIHGESYLLKHHQEWVQKNYANIHSHLLFNGQLLAWKAKEKGYSIERYSQWEKPRLFLSPRFEIDRSQISERRKLASLGLVVASVVKNISSGEYHIQLTFKGLVVELEDQRDKIIQFLKDLLASSSFKDLGPEKNERSEFLRIALRREVSKYIEAKPVTIVHFH